MVLSAGRSKSGGRHAGHETKLSQLVLVLGRRRLREVSSLARTSNNRVILAKSLSLELGSLAGLAECVDWSRGVALWTRGSAAFLPVNWLVVGIREESGLGEGVFRRLVGFCASGDVAEEGARVLPVPAERVEGVDDEAHGCGYAVGRDTCVFSLWPLMRSPVGILCESHEVMKVFYVDGELVWEQ